MKVVAEYSHNQGKEFIEKNHKTELEEVKEIVSLVDASKCRTKESEEITMPGKLLYSPKDFNREFEKLFRQRGWQKAKVRLSTKVPETGRTHSGYREIDMVKNKLGVELQFGKYAFMIYNVAAKMTIFAKQGVIDSGIEMVPMKSLAKEMSTGVSYLEQMKADLEYRGVSNIDVPVLIIGIDCVREGTNQKLHFDFK